LVIATLSGIALLFILIVFYCCWKRRRQRQRAREKEAFEKDDDEYDSNETVRGVVGRGIRRRNPGTGSPIELSPREATRSHNSWWQSNNKKKKNIVTSSSSSSETTRDFRGSWSDTMVNMEPAFSANPLHLKTRWEELGGGVVSSSHPGKLTPSTVRKVGEVGSSEEYRTKIIEAELRLKEMRDHLNFFETGKGSALKSYNPRDPVTPIRQQASSPPVSSGIRSPETSTSLEYQSERGKGPSLIPPPPPPLPPKNTPSEGSNSGGGGGGGGGGNNDNDSAHIIAQELWKGGAGELPPDWHWDYSSGRPFFTSPDGATTWIDPRENYLDYEAHFVAARGRGVNLREYASVVALLGSPLPPPPPPKKYFREFRAHFPPDVVANPSAWKWGLS